MRRHISDPEYKGSDPGGQNGNLGYKEQWITLLAMTDDIRAFLTEHDAELKTKSEA